MTKEEIEKLSEGDRVVLNNYSSYTWPYNEGDGGVFVGVDNNTYAKVKMDRTNKEVLVSFRNIDLEVDLSCLWE